MLTLIKNKLQKKILQFWNILFNSESIQKFVYIDYLWICNMLRKFSLWNIFRTVCRNKNDRWHGQSAGPGPRKLCRTNEKPQQIEASALAPPNDMLNHWCTGLPTIWIEPLVIFLFSLLSHYRDPIGMLDIDTVYLLMLFYFIRVTNVLLCQYLTALGTLCRSHCTCPCVCPSIRC